MAIAPVVWAQLASPRPPSVRPTQSFSRIEGEVWVNAQIATMQTPVQAEDSVETGPNSRASFVVGEDAYMLRSNAQLRILRTQPRSQTSNLIEEGIELLKGAALFVFGRREERRVRVLHPMIRLAFGAPVFIWMQSQTGLMSVYVTARQIWKWRRTQPITNIWNLPIMICPSIYMRVDLPNWSKRRLSRITLILSWLFWKIW